VTNYFAAEGGLNKEDPEMILRRPPGKLLQRDRAVHRDDFVALAQESSSQVVRAKAILVNGDLELYFLPLPSTGMLYPDLDHYLGLRDFVASYLARRSALGLRPVVKFAQLVLFDLSVEVLLKDSRVMLEHEEVISDRIRAHFSPYPDVEREGWPFGRALSMKELDVLLGDLTMVRHFTSAHFYPLTSQEEVPGWERGLGAAQIQLNKTQLPALRRIRVKMIYPSTDS